MNKWYSLRTIFIVILLFILLLSGQEKSKTTNVEKFWFDGNVKGVITQIDKSSNLIDIYNLAYAEMLNGNLDKALSLAAKLENEKPQLFLYLTGNIYRLQGNTKKALASLTLYYEDNEDDFSILLNISELLIASKRFEEARKLLIERVDDGDDERLYDKIAYTYLAENKLDEGLTWLKEAEAIYPSLEIMWHLIQIYDLTKNVNKIREYGLKLSNMYSGSEYSQQLIDVFKKHGLDPELLKPLEEKISPISLNVGEILKYEVSYGFFHLGEILITVKDEIVYEGKPCYVVEYKVDTASGLPFFSLHYRYTAILDKYSMLGYKSLVFMDETTGFNRKAYIMDYKKHQLRIYKINDEGRIDYVQKPLPDVAVDAMSLLFYSRNLVKNKVSKTVTTIIDDSYKTADIYFQNQQEEIDILGQSVNSEEIYAKANFTGLAGMTGDVWGWFIDTESACVPAIGKAQIFLGKVTITLEKWRP